MTREIHGNGAGSEESRVRQAFDRGTRSRGSIQSLLEKALPALRCRDVRTHRTSQDTDRNLVRFAQSLMIRPQLLTLLHRRICSELESLINERFQYILVHRIPTILP